MISRQARIATTILFIGLLAAGQACFSRSSSPPVPSAEIPPFLVFPPTTSIDVDKIAPEGGAALKLAVPPGGAFSQAVTSGGTTAAGVNAINDNALSPISGVRVSVTSSATHYVSETDSAFSGANPIKVDFGDFDLDGDGAAEGCSGCVCPVGCTTSCPTEGAIADFKPICFRLWVNRTGTYERWLAGKVTEPPTDPDADGIFDNPGAGRYRSSLTFQEGGAQHTALLGAVYDHTDTFDPFMKSTELFVRDDTASSRERAHTLTQQEKAYSGATVSSEVRKTLNINATESNLAEDTVTALIEYLARFREDMDFWIGTVTTEGGAAAQNQCVDLTTGEGTAAENCSDNRLSLDGETVGPATDADVAFPGPDQFPLDPCSAPNLASSPGC